MKTEYCGPCGPNGIILKIVSGRGEVGKESVWKINLEVTEKAIKVHN